MRKYGLTLAGVAAVVASLFAGEAYAIPASGTFTFTPGNGGIATVNNGTLINNPATTSKSVTSPGSTSASTGNLGIAAGSTATITPAANIPITSGAVSVAIAAGGFTFTFTSQTLNILTSTVLATNTTGFIGDSLSGTITAAPAGFDLGTAVADAQSCQQPVSGGTAGAISCSDSIVVGATVSTPEPGSLALLGSALIGLGAFRRRRRSA